MKNVQKGHIFTYSFSKHTKLIIKLKKFLTQTYMPPRKNLPYDIWGLHVSWTRLESERYLRSRESEQDRMEIQKYTQTRGYVDFITYEDILKMEQMVDSTINHVTVKQMTQIIRKVANKFKRSDISKRIHLAPRSSTMCKIFMEDYRDFVLDVVTNDMLFNGKSWIQRDNNSILMGPQNQRHNVNFNHENRNETNNSIVVKKKGALMSTFHKILNMTCCVCAVPPAYTNFMSLIDQKKTLSFTNKKFSNTFNKPENEITSKSLSTSNSNSQAASPIEYSHNPQIVVSNSIENSSSLPIPAINNYMGNPQNDTRNTASDDIGDQLKCSQNEELIHNQMKLFNDPVLNDKFSNYTLDFSKLNAQPLSSPNVELNSGYNHPFGPVDLQPNDIKPLDPLLMFQIPGQVLDNILPLNS